MSPEQAQGLSADRRTDVYSLGAILYECLTGRPPFNAANPLDTMRLVIQQTPAPARALNPTLPRDLETIASRCLAKEPQGRYPTAQALADDLNRFQRGEPIQARPATPIERAWRWSRRKPALATLALVLLAIPNIIIALQYRNQHALRQERDRVLEASQRAERSEALARENLYAAELNLAWTALDGGDLEQARTLLKRHFPQDSRFEGRLLSSQLREAQQSMWSSSNRFVAASIDPSGSAIGVLTPDALVRLNRTNQDFEDYAFPLASTKFALPPLTIVLDSPRHRIAFSDQESLFLWNHPTHSPPNRIAMGRCSRLASRREDGWLAAAMKTGTNQQVRVFDTEAFLPVAEHSFPEVCTLAWARGIGELFVVTLDGAIWRWNVPRDEPSLRLEGTTTVFGAAFSPDFSRVARATSHRLMIHDLRSGKPLVQFPLAVDTNVRLAWSPDAHYLAISDIAGTIQVCGSEDGNIYRRFLEHVGAVADIAWLDTNSFLSVGTDGAILRWRLQAPFGPLGQIHLDSTASAVFSADGKRLAIGSSQIPLTVWDTTEGLVLQEHPPTTPAGLSPNGAQLLVRHGSTVRLLDATGRKTESPLSFSFQDLAGSDRGGFRLSSDGRTFITQAANAALILFDATSGRWLATSRPGIEVFAATLDGRQFVLGNSNEVGLWDSRSGASTVIAPHRASALAMGAYGRLVAVGDSQGRITVWDAESRANLQTFAAHVGSVRSLAFTSEERTLASSGDDRFVKLWHPRLGRQLGVPTRVLRMSVLIFSPQNDRLFGGGIDGCRQFSGPLDEQTAALAVGALSGSESGTFWESPHEIEALRVPEPVAAEPHK